MKKLVITALLVAAVMAAAPALAQMRFLEEGGSGFGLGAGISSGDGMTGLGGGFVYTASGKFDLGINVNRLSFDDDVIGNDGSALGFTPFLALGLVRPEGDQKLGLELGASWEKASYDSDGLDALEWDMSSTGLTGTLSMYMRADVSPSLVMFPEVSVGYITGNVEIEDSFGDSVDDDISEAIFGAAVSFFFNDRVRLTPSLVSIDGETTWGVTLGVVMAGN